MQNERSLTPETAAGNQKLAAAAPAGAVDGEIITETELCRRLAISSGTAKNWRDAGKLPFIRLSGRSVRFHYPSVLSAMLRAQRGGGL